MSGASITVAGVRRFIDGLAIVDQISFEAEAGKVLALLGPSGSGKSTLLRLIAGLEPLDGGRILFGDDEVTRTAPEARRVGMVFQDYALFPHLDALANVMFGLDRLAPAQRENIARHWLERVGLARRAEAYPQELSGGEQQRVALARALAPNPRVALLDEPFSGLDPVLRAELRQTTLDALRESQATAIFVTHDAEEAFYVGDRIAILRAGKLLQIDTPRGLYESPNCADAAAAVGPVNLYGGVITGARVITPFGAISTDLPEGSPALVVVRAEALTLQPGVRARVIDRRPQGAQELLFIEAGGAVWRAATPARLAPKVGASVEVTIDPAGAFVFLR
ncbi:MAG: ABC transporter ATP-binding protein [Hydrogenophilaceae bacterium]|jgi:iron(III) transport system ATP-binding protein|nr:ABC transporter ATP-binding protein [Hydrogenophilaceae bacterium]